MFAESEEAQLQTVAELVRLAQEGDREAQCLLYQRYLQSALSLACRQLGNRDEAEELVQDVFIHAFDRIEQLRVPEAFGGWLRQIIRRMSINRLTRQRTTVSIEIDALDAAYCEQETPLDRAMSVERCQQVRSGLQRLGDMDRRTLEAFYMGGHSLIEMAEQFDAPIGTIKRRLHIARKRLAQEIVGLQAI